MLPNLQINGVLFKNGADACYIDFFNDKHYKIEPEILTSARIIPRSIPKSGIILIEISGSRPNYRIKPVVMVDILDKYGQEVTVNQLTKDELITVAFNAATQYIANIDQMPDVRLANSLEELSS